LILAVFFQSTQIMTSVHLICQLMGSLSETLQPVQKASPSPLEEGILDEAEADCTAALHVDQIELVREVLAGQVLLELVELLLLLELDGGLLLGGGGCRCPFTVLMGLELDVVSLVFRRGPPRR
jgi:hypothetical protein